MGENTKKKLLLMGAVLIAVVSLMMERAGGIVECLIGIAFMSGLVVLFMN